MFKRVNEARIESSGKGLGVGWADVDFLPQRHEEREGRRAGLQAFRVIDFPVKGAETFVCPQVRKPAIQQARRPALRGESFKAQRFNRDDDGSWREDVWAR